jgi:hypothetical protein
MIPRIVSLEMRRDRFTNVKAIRNVLIYTARFRQSMLLSVFEGRL